MARRRSVAVAAVLLTFGLAGSRGEAYVRYRTESGAAYSWRQTRARLVAYPKASEFMTREQVIAAMQGSASAWDRRDPNVSECSYFEIELSIAGEEEAIPVAASDYHNILVVRDDVWGCEPGTDAQDASCYDPNALALTTLTTLKKSGEILDADIEVNGVYDEWGDLTADPSSLRQDLQNALTHEIGHFIGLDHPCYLGRTPDPLPVDNLGAPVVSCRVTSDAVKNATMFPSSTPGDLELRSLSDDDLAALCEIYPLAANPNTYELPGTPAGCTCVFGGSDPVAQVPSAVVTLGLALVTVLGRRRRR